MRILLLGGTGAMGVHLKDLLVARGDEVFITTRSRREGCQHLHYLQGNAHDMVFLKSVLDNGWDAIVDFMVYSTDEFKNRVSLLLNSTYQYIFISSARVYANMENPLKETSPRLLDSCQDKLFLATDEYALKKAREEDILFKSGKNNYTIVRPYITYSENRLQLGDLELGQWLPRALDGRTLVFSKDLADHYTTLTYGYDVARGIVSLIGNKKAEGEAFNITGSKAIKWSEVLTIYLDTIATIIGKRPGVKWTEHSEKLKNEELKYQILYDRCTERVFDNSKILSIDPSLSFTEPEAGLSLCVKAFAKTKAAKHFSVIEEASRDRITKEKMNLSDFKSAKHKFLYILCRYFNFDKITKH